MTKTTNIKWRLANRPTPDEVALLHDKGLLTKDEAREILFNLETEEDRDKKSLEAEVEFLRKLVEKLSTAQTIIQTIHEVKTPYYVQPWFQPYQHWMSNSGTLYRAGISAQSSLAVGSSNTANLASMQGTATAGSVTIPTQSFSAIKTF